MSYREWKEAFVDGREKSGLTEVNGKPFAKETEYLVRNHVPGADTTAERAVVDKLISSVLPKVPKTLNNY